MIMTFVKKMLGYLFSLFVIMAIAAACLLLADKLLGEALWGVVAMTTLAVLFMIGDRSWNEAKREHDEV